MGLAADVKSLITTAGVSSVYVGGQPASPDNCATFFHTGGGRDLAGSMIGDLTFTILCRHKTQAGAMVMAETVRMALHGVTENGNLMLVECVGGMMDMGEDENKRREVGQNFRALYRD